MDRLWAPWRQKYIRFAGKRKGCIFCLALKDRKDKYVVFKTRYSMVMLNKFPYNNGHLMLAPLRHIKDFTQLEDAEILDLFKALKQAQSILKATLAPEGFNIGANISRSAGAGVPGHLHIHIVPRWNGDTNLMPVLFAAKVISQSLAELSARLKKAYAKKYN